MCDVRYEVNHCSERGNAEQCRKTMEQDGVVESIKVADRSKKTEARVLLLRDSVRKMVM